MRSFFSDFGLISAPGTQFYLKISSQDPVSSKKNLFRWPYFCKPGQHVPTKTFEYPQIRPLSFCLSQVGGLIYFLPSLELTIPFQTPPHISFFTFYHCNLALEYGVSRFLKTLQAVKQSVPGDVVTIRCLGQDNSPTFQIHMLPFYTTTMWRGNTRRGYTGD